jgi:hypothetical protein
MIEISRNDHTKPRRTTKEPIKRLYTGPRRDLLHGPVPDRGVLEEGKP